MNTFSNFFKLQEVTESSLTSTNAFPLLYPTKAATLDVFLPNVSSQLIHAQCSAVKSVY